MDFRQLHVVHAVMKAIVKWSTMLKNELTDVTYSSSCSSGDVSSGASTSSAEDADSYTYVKQ